MCQNIINSSNNLSTILAVSHPINKLTSLHFFIRISKIISSGAAQEAITSLKNNKSTGPDEIKNEFIKYGSGEITKSLSQTFNKTFENETITISWNKSNANNIVKESQTKNYYVVRGVSLTNNICKIFEKVINNRIKLVLSLTEAQVGAREGRSSVDQFIIKSVIQQRKFQRKKTHIALTDIEKAFDYTWRERLFYNL